MNATYPHPRNMGARQVAGMLAPLVDMDNPDDIGAYLVLVVTTDGQLAFTGTDNIPPTKIPVFLKWAARNMQFFIREAN